jgi:DNA-binding transcriptional regulator YiaG
LIMAGLLWTPWSGTTSTYLIERPVVLTASDPDGRQLVHRPAETAGEAILEIRRRSGLTWDELADLFEVSRRSVHHWASGKPVTAEHDQHIRRTLAVIRQIDQGEARRTRDILLAPAADGILAFDLLKNEEFEDVVARGGPTPTRVVPPLTELSPEARHARRVPRPAELVAALNDRPLLSTTARMARTFRAPKVT